MKTKVSILDKYIFTQVFAATLVCLFLFVIVWIAPETLVRIIRQIFIDHITLKQAGLNLFYELPKVLEKALPVGILLGSIFTFDKLSKNSELIIIRGIGISFSRLMASVLMLGAVLSLVCFFVGDRLVPWASAVTKEDAGFNEHFVYIQKDDTGKPKQGVIISNHTPNKIKNLTVINFAKNDYEDIAEFSSILTAPYAKKFDDKWILPEAKEYKIDKDGVYEKIGNVKDYPILIGEDASQVYELMINSTIRERGFTSAQMHDYIKLLKLKDYTDEYNYLLAKYYQRHLHPLTCILFAAIGCLLGFAPPRSQRLVGFTVAVGIVFAYYITLPFFDLLAEKGAMPPFVTASIPILAFIVAIFTIKKMKDL